MYFGENNHGCPEYSKKIAFYTQTDRLFLKYTVHGVVICIDYFEFEEGCASVGDNVNS